MRDNYVGDIGDFAKYGLLRAVSEGRRLGIAWYMCGYAEVGGAGDGRHIGYLKNPTQWRHLDRELFDTLKKLVENDRRSVVTLQDTGILGDVVYASTLVDVAGVAVRNRKDWRREWFDQVLDRLSGCDLVFADPDNGLCADEKFNPGRRENAKWIPLHEANALAAGRTAIIYHHNGRQLDHISEIRDWMSRIPGCTFAYYWRRWSNRTFFIINADPEMEDRVERFAERWRGAGELVRDSSSAIVVGEAISSPDGEAPKVNERVATRRKSADLDSMVAASRISRVASGEETMHKRVLDMLIRRYDRPIMNNLQRGDYVECMIAWMLGEEWQLTSEDGWEWAAWDCEHVSTGVRLEIKQSAARQSWDGGAQRPRRSPRFDIAPRKGYWPKDGSAWVSDPRRLADVYAFAWHGEVDEHTDHRDPVQWRFFVATEQHLPVGQKSIGLGELEKISVSCDVLGLKRAVEEAYPKRELS